MTELVFGLDGDIAAWVAGKVPDVRHFGPSAAIGIADGKRLVAGVVYSNWRGRDIEMSIASEDPRWCSRHNLRVLFAYPFRQLRCARVTAITKRKSKTVRRFLERMGFRQEGVIRGAYVDDDACVYGMLKKECRWINSAIHKEKIHG